MRHRPIRQQEMMRQSRSDCRSKIHVYFLNRHPTSEYLTHIVYSQVNTVFPVIEALTCIRHLAYIWDRASIRGTTVHNVKYSECTLAITPIIAPWLSNLPALVWLRCIQEGYMHVLRCTAMSLLYDRSTAPECGKQLMTDADMKSENFFEWAPHLSTRGHKYKLYKKSSSVSVLDITFFWTYRQRMEFTTWWNWFS